MVTRQLTSPNTQGTGRRQRKQSQGEGGNNQNLNTFHAVLASSLKRNVVSRPQRCAWVQAWPCRALRLEHTLTEAIEHKTHCRGYTLKMAETRRSDYMGGGGPKPVCPANHRHCKNTGRLAGTAEGEGLGGGQHTRPQSRQSRAGRLRRGWGKAQDSGPHARKTHGT